MLKINTVTREKIIEILESYEVSSLDISDLTNELLDLFGVSKPLAPKEVKSCMKADLKCGKICKEHCGASWC